MFSATDTSPLQTPGHLVSNRPLPNIGLQPTTAGEIMSRRG
jgi:hypothetical protein